MGHLVLSPRFLCCPVSLVVGGCLLLSGGLQQQRAAVVAAPELAGEDEKEVVGWLVAVVAAVGCGGHHAALNCRVSMKSAHLGVAFDQVTSRATGEVVIGSKALPTVLAS